jgi:hypothetical protein
MVRIQVLHIQYPNKKQKRYLNDAGEPAPEDFDD